jgi:hypothetical protein
MFVYIEANPDYTAKPGADWQIAIAKHRSGSDAENRGVRLGFYTLQA